ncbi:MAG: hypothetical protein ISS46_01625 [Candidatus Omnitrophica bacterium]|nr:hypothetical protein [Candidatus Omnitrophota bacterium]
MGVLIGGIVALILGVIGMSRLYASFWIVLKGTIPAILILGGLASIGVGISSIKDKLAAKTEEAAEKKAEKKE